MTCKNGYCTMNKDNYKFIVLNFSCCQTNKNKQNMHWLNVYTWKLYFKNVSFHLSHHLNEQKTRGEKQCISFSRDRFVYQLCDHPDSFTSWNKLNQNKYHVEKQAQCSFETFFQIYCSILQLYYSFEIK